MNCGERDEYINSIDHLSYTDSAQHIPVSQSLWVWIPFKPGFSIWFRKCSLNVSKARDPVSLPILIPCNDVTRLSEDYTIHAISQWQGRVKIAFSLFPNKTQCQSQNHQIITYSIITVGEKMVANSNDTESRQIVFAKFITCFTRQYTAWVMNIVFFLI